MASNRRAKGSVEKLPSGALRVRVYAGIDPVTGRRHYLTEQIPAGRNAEREAEAVRARLVAEVVERRNPRTRATVAELLERYLAQFDGSPNTLRYYEGLVRNHIGPLIGRVAVGQVDAEILDSLYAELRRCRKHCTGRGGIDHRTDGDHECDDRCRPHRCRPLGVSAVRAVHYVLSGAFRRAVRWRWVAVNPIAEGEPPAAKPPNPRPPTPAQAARILTEAWDKDPAWGALLWLITTTGMRRGELCALRWHLLEIDDADRAVVWIREAVRKGADGRPELADLKTHQQRRIALDAETVEMLREHRAEQERAAAALGVDLRPDGFVFSSSPASAEFLKPDTVTQRYERLARRLGIETTLHKLRHYSATELIAAGVDIRTVAGRLGHGGGGVTTLRVYSAWVSEADQRAASQLVGRIPAVRRSGRGSC